VEGKIADLALNRLIMLLEVILRSMTTQKKRGSFFAPPADASHTKPYPDFSARRGCPEPGKVPGPQF
jgi:hypothetical protein